MGCPKCNDDDVEQVGNFKDVDDATISIPMKCNNCGIKFYDIYVFSCYGY